MRPANAILYASGEVVNGLTIIGEAPAQWKNARSKFWTVACACSNQFILSGTAVREKQTRKCKTCDSACSKEGCGQPVHGWGLCSSHYRAEYTPGYQRDYWRRTIAERHFKNNIYSRTIRGQYKNLKHNAKEKGHEVAISLDEFAFLRENSCHYCGGGLAATGQGLDRKDNTVGYLFDNCVPCCSECNYTKGSRMTYAEMVNLISFRKESEAAERMICGC